MIISIHSIYGLDINDPGLVDTPKLGVHLALLRENQQDDVSKKQTLKIPKAKKNHCLIRKKIMQNQSTIISRTQAKNTKSSYAIVDEERAEILSAEMRTWRSLLPTK